LKQTLKWLLNISFFFLLLNKIFSYNLIFNQL